MKLLNKHNALIIILSVIIVFMTVAFCTHIIPKMNLKRTVSSQDSNIAYKNNGSMQYELKQEHKLVQTFVPEYKRVDSIGIVVDSYQCNKDAGFLKCEIKDAKGNTVAVRDIEGVDIPEYGWCEVMKDIKLEAGREYYLELETFNMAGTDIRLVYRDVTSTGISETAARIFKTGTKGERNTLLMSFEYSIKQGMNAYMPFCVLSFLLTWILVVKLAMISANRRS